MTYEDALLGELAHVTGVTRAVLADELHRMHPAFSAAAPPRPPEQPVTRPSPKPPIKVSKHEYLGEFTVAGAGLVVGELTESTGDIPPGADERRSVASPAVPGTWYAFVKGGDDVEALVVVHRDHAGDLKKLAKAALPLSRVIVGGGRLTILDASVRDNATYVDDAMFPLFPEGLVLDRGCHTGTGGDGVFPVHGVTMAAKLVFVAVSFTGK